MPLGPNPASVVGCAPGIPSSVSRSANTRRRVSARRGPGRRAPSASASASVTASASGWVFALATERC